MLDSLISSMPMGHCLHSDNIAMIMMGAGVVAYSFIMVITPCLSCETISSEKIKDFIYKQKKLCIIRLFLTNHIIYM